MQYLMMMLQEYIVAPVVIAACCAIVALIKRYGDRLTRNTSAKSELETVMSSVEIRRSIMDELDKIVQAAVATNMSFVEDLKKNGRKLTDAEANELNESARTMIFNSLPTDLKAPDSKVMAILGGQEALDAIIKMLIERHVYEYKPISKDNIEYEMNVYGTNEIGYDEPQDPSAEEPGPITEDIHLYNAATAEPEPAEAESIIPSVYTRGVG